MAFTLDNFVRSILAVDAAVGDTSLVLASAAPPLRDPPAALTDAPGILILQDQPTAPSKIEIVTYTGVSIAGTQVTLSGVTRGLEGTTAQAWTAGTQTFSGTTAAVLAQFALKAALGTAAATDSADYATAAQGATADSALQPDDVGSAAFTDATSYATAAQGAKADSALQDASAFATAAQGAKADSALQDASAFATAAQGAAADAAMPKAGGDFINAIGVVGNGFDAAKISFLNTSGGNTTRWYVGQRYYGATNIQLVCNIGGVDAFVINFDGTLKIRNANSTTLTQQPRIFVQSADPGAAAADGDLLIW